MKKKEGIFSGRMGFKYLHTGVFYWNYNSHRLLIMVIVSILGGGRNNFRHLSISQINGIHLIQGQISFLYSSKGFQQHY